MAIPTRLLKELGQIAARYNEQTTEHATGCCPVCRRFMRGLWAALTDDSNWQDEPIGVQISRIQDQIDRLSHLQREAEGMRRAAPRTATAEPIHEEESQETPPFPPPPIDE